MYVILTSLERELLQDTGCTNNFEFKGENDFDLYSYLTEGSNISYRCIIYITWKQDGYFVL